MKKEAASKVLEAYLALDRKLVASIQRMRSNVPAEEQRKHFLPRGLLAMDLRRAMDLVVDEHPSLKPPGMS
ncbi:MAG: hypothetical protein HOO96_35580 [Polyangiaceae bacterium]|nr:hypothetical protein [Polyangiaceae bacterium]